MGNSKSMQNAMGTPDGSDRQQIEKKVDMYMTTKGTRVPSLIPTIAKKYNLNPQCCVETFADTDAELTQWAQTVIERTDLLAIIVSGRNVGNFRRSKDLVLGVDGMNMLAQLTDNNMGLKCLVINGHVLDESRAQALVNGIMNNNELVYVDLFDNFVDSTGAAYFLNNLKTLRKFHHLVLAGNGNINSKTKLAIKEVEEDRKKNYPNLPNLTVAY